MRQLQVQNGLWLKRLERPLGDEELDRLLTLNRFRAVEDGVVLACAPYHGVRDGCLIMGVAQGEPLSRILSKSGRACSPKAARQAAARAVTLAGRWLAHFHQWTSHGYVEPYDLDERRQRAEGRVESLVRYGLPMDRAERLRECFAGAWSEGVADRVTTIHGDFKADNLVVAPASVLGVDMEGYHRGPPLVDLVQFASHVFVARSGACLGAGRPGWWRELVGRFFDAYGEVPGLCCGSLDSHLLAFVCAVFATMVERHRIFFYGLRWRNLMIRTIDELLDHPSYTTSVTKPQILEEARVANLEVYSWQWTLRGLSESVFVVMQKPPADRSQTTALNTRGEPRW